MPRRLAAAFSFVAESFGRLTILRNAIISAHQCYAIAHPQTVRICALSAADMRTYSALVKRHPATTIALGKPICRSLRGICAAKAMVGLRLGFATSKNGDRLVMCTR